MKDEEEPANEEATVPFSSSTDSTQEKLGYQLNQVCDTDKILFAFLNV